MQAGSNSPDTQDWEYTLEVPVTVKPSINFITLLSTTVGLTVSTCALDVDIFLLLKIFAKAFTLHFLNIMISQNYGDHFDTIPEGIAGGPVELVGNGNLTRNLSTNPWTYKVKCHEKKNNAIY